MVENKNNKIFKIELACLNLSLYHHQIEVLNDNKKRKKNFFIGNRND